MSIKKNDNIIKPNADNWINDAIATNPNWRSAHQLSSVSCQWLICSVVASSGLKSISQGIIINPKSIACFIAQFPLHLLQKLKQV